MPTSDERSAAYPRGTKRRRWKRTVAGLCAVVLVLVGGCLLFVYSGIYNVAATAGHNAFIEKTARKTMERSVRRHAAGVDVPVEMDLRDREYAAQFYGHFHEACVTCHSAPGVPADPWMVNYPPAPDLTDPDVVERWSDRELFWIIKHGVKDTAMIALGPTHEDKDVWGVTAIVRQLPQMSKNDYTAMGRRYEAAKRREKSATQDQPSRKDAPANHEHSHSH